MHARRDLLWLRRDLRLIDNDLFAGRSGAESLLCVYVLNPEWLGAAREQLGAAAWASLWDSLISLRGNLLSRGSDLLVCVGDPARILPALMRRTGAMRLQTHEMDGSNERDVVRQLAAAIGDEALCLIPESPLFTYQGEHESLSSSLPFAEFSQRASHWRALPPVSVALPVSLPPWPEDAPRGLPSMKSLSLPRSLQTGASTLGGEDDAQRHMARLASGDRAWRQADTQMLLDWRALGCLSARQLYALCASVDANLGDDESPRERLRQELLWREYRRWQRQRGVSPSAGAAGCVDPMGGGESILQEGLRSDQASPAKATSPASTSTGHSWYDRL